MPYEHITVKVSENVCTIKLERPEIRNALILEMRKELIDLFSLIKHQDEIKAVVLTGEVPAFSAGGDLKTLKNMDAISGSKRLQTGHDLIRAILNLEKPVIAAVNGGTAGAGFSLALACDIIFASRSAFFIQSFVKVGLIPDLGSIHFLTQLIGSHRAKQLMFTGEQISEDQAYELAIINEVVEDKRLIDRCFFFACELARGPGIAIGLTKGLSKNIHVVLEDSLELEGFAQGLCLETKDFQEGVQAFFEKREPSFNGN